jgi:hypothetical protein
MHRLRSGLAAAAILSLFSISGCGGHSQPGVSPYPARVSLNPAISASLQLGGFLVFSASAQNSSNGNVSTTFTWISSDTSILNVAPNGVACAGHWNQGYTICTPGGIGVAQVTASAFGATSPPTYVFVHPPIDNIQVNGVLLNNIPIQEPCLSQGQTMTVEAHAYSQGTDITTAVGPFTWSANNVDVVKITPLVNNNGSPPYAFATNQATITAAIPGITQIYATSSGVTSTTFYQPQYQNTQGVTSPLLDFFETCPIQNITLEVGPAGSQQTGETTFVTSKGTPQNASAIVTDVMGNNSLPQANTTVTLSKIPLTWTASQPAVIAPGNGCTESCTLSTPLPGAGSVTASCSPPTCNIGFPYVPVALSSLGSLAACAQFFGFASCQQFIPVPVYASAPLLSGQTIPTGPGAISGIVTGSTSFTSVLATSNGCQSANPLDCSVAVYNVSTSKPVAGGATPLPNPPNSLLFDLAGDKAYMGSEIGAVLINPVDIGTGTSPFTPVGTVTGNVLSVSNTGSFAVFSDPRFAKVFIVNTTTSGGSSVTALDIANASAAAFSPDAMKAFIFGLDSNNNPNLFIYSTIQGLQTIPLPANTAINSIAFSPNGAFAYLLEASTIGGPSNVTAFSVCNSQIGASVPLPSPPVAMQVLPAPHIAGTDTFGNTIPDGTHVMLLDATGLDIITSTITAPVLGTLSQPGILCPQTLQFISNDPTRPAQRIELAQGTIAPVNFFSSADGTLLYVLASNRPSVFVYNFAISSVNGIELTGNATPLSGSMSADAGTILIAGSDGLLHEVSTALGGTDMIPPLSFPNLPNYLNPFCTYTPSSGPCTFSMLAVKP